MQNHRPPSFSRALRAVRTARGLPQEAFDQVSSRTYVSTLERGLKEPTLSKVSALADVCEVHPLTLLLLSFCNTTKASEVDRLLLQVKQEFESLDLADL
jgi:transcriptional regulator with XRE-family HTH domain